MSEFVCKKPIILSGHSFSYGEIILDGFVLPDRVLSLVRSNYISEIEVGTIPERPIQLQTGTTLIAIPISTEKGNLEITMSSETVVGVLTTMQKTVEEATKDIATMEDKDSLILLNAVDSRSGIQKAAEKRAMQLAEQPPEESGNYEDKSGELESSEEGESTGDA